MSAAPPVLTPERIDAMLSATAEICMAAIEKAGARVQAAADDAGFEKAERSLNRACRNLRQTIALKQRFDRERLAMKAEQRRDAVEDREDAEQAHRTAVARHRAPVRRHFERLAWSEYEESDAQAFFEDLDVRLHDLARDEDFLDTPVETLIARLTEELFIAEPEDDEGDDSVAAGAGAPGEAIERLSFNAAPPPTDRAAVSRPPDPPGRPPDPPPKPEPDPLRTEPCLPPWEKLRPDQVFRNDSGG